MPFYAAIPIALGIASVVIAFYSKRVMTLPSLQKVKAAYPIINVAIATAADMTDGTPYDFLLDAAAKFWSGEGLSAEEAARLATASVTYFDRRKFLETNKQLIDPAAIAQGQKIAKALVPND